MTNCSKINFLLKDIERKIEFTIAVCSIKVNSGAAGNIQSQLACHFIISWLLIVSNYQILLVLGVSSFALHSNWILLGRYL